MPYAQIVRLNLQAGRLGRLGLVRIHHWGDGETVELDDVLLRASLVGQLDVACWLFDMVPECVFAIAWPEQAIRPAADSTVHMPLPMQQNRDERVTGTTFSSADRPDASDFQVHLGFPSGGMAIINDCRSPGGGTTYDSLTAIGSHGAVYADDHHNMHLQFDATGTRSLPTGQGDNLREMLLQFAAAIRGDHDGESMLDDMRRSIRTARAAVASARSGRAVCRAGEQYELV